MAPTKTLPPRLADLTVRQAAGATVTVTAQTNSDSSGSSSSSLSGGEIAGIVIGTIAGLLLIWWVVRTLSGNKEKPSPPPDRNRQGWYDDEPTVRRSRSRGHSHSQQRHHHHHHRRGSGVVFEEKDVAYAPRRPSATYVNPERRPRSTGRSRSRSDSGRYYTSH
ncbi:hypothetical protein B0T24DRAFT_618977 [Lasiosphaeria ovina]|uniref:Uncharacterized protein n=1 Tax=Lasiosphaeria ovina TaxID=92902 RepID=A0AAE0KIE4_9PEZI|nr:hypothetical protein B0T24DRAFT_618977 [Lasiosphaeria ovina]